MIYFIQCGHDGPIKIGQTGGHVVWRCKQIQHSSPFELHILGCHEGGLKEEQELHRRFSADRFRNEWFNPVPELLEHIKATDAARKFEVADSSDIRLLTTAEAKKRWSAAARREFRDEVNKLGRPYTAWREHIAPLRPSTRAALTTLLERLGVAKTEIQAVTEIAPSDLVVAA